VLWNWEGKTDVLGGKTCSNATLSTTNPTWTDPGSNPGLRGEGPATNRLSHGTALVHIRVIYPFKVSPLNLMTLVTSGKIV
jgi:hypothetical protein